MLLSSHARPDFNGMKVVKALEKDATVSPMRVGWAKRAAAVLFALAAVATACNGNGEASTTTTEATTTTSTTTTTTAPTTTTVAIAGPEPWTDVVRDIYRRNWALYTNPDPAAVSRVYADECECHQSFADTIEFLASHGERLVGEPPHPVAVRAEGPTTPDGSQLLTVKVDAGPQQRVDANGNVVQEIPDGEPSCVSLFVRPDGANGAYRVHDLFIPQGCPEGL